VLSLLLTLLLGCGGSQKESEDLKIKIPTKWIEKLRKFDYTEKNIIALSKEFEEFIKPKMLEYDTFDIPIFNPVFVDLDGDSEEELLLLMGTEYTPILTVFKKINRNWYLIFVEHFMEFYIAPELQIANNYSRNGKKTIVPSIKFSVSEIGYDDKGEINTLTITDNKNIVRYKLGTNIQQPQTTQNTEYEDNLILAMQCVKEANTIDELQKVWGEWSFYRNDKRFKDEVTKRKVYEGNYENRQQEEEHTPCTIREFDD